MQNGIENRKTNYQSENATGDAAFQPSQLEGLPAQSVPGWCCTHEMRDSPDC